MKKIIIWILVLINSTFVFAETDSELAQLYLDEAFFFYNSENYILADEYLQDSMAFSDKISEAWFLAGLIKEDQGNRLKALDSYRQSLLLSDEYSHFFYDLFSHYLNLLNITAHHKEVLDLYKEYENNFNHYKSIVLKVSDSAFRYGLVDYSIELATDVFKRNPHNLKAMIYLIRSTKDYKYYSIIEKSLINLEKDKLDEVLFQDLILENRYILKDKTIGLYEEIFGQTPFYHMVTGINHESINESRNLMIRSSGNEKLEDGVYFGDYNFDGVSDEIVSVSGSELTYLKDGNQDNITDLSINFENDKPSAVFLNKGETLYEFRYSDYPYVEEIHYIKNNLTRIYKIFPGTIYTPLLDLTSFNWKYKRNRQVVTEGFKLSPLSLLPMAYLIEEYFSDKKHMFREYTLKDGEVTKIKEDTQNNGFFDHFLEISAWQTESGKRDINLDGSTDIFEYYEDGKITGIAVDWNNNGKPEYLEDWSVLDLKTWDFDEDSYCDAEYISSRQGEIYKSIPAEKENVNQFDIYSWDFSFDNIWFNNN